MAAVPGLGSEALELIVADDLEAKPDREQQHSESIDCGECDGFGGAYRDEEGQGDEPQDRALQPEDREQAPPPECAPMRGAHRLVAWILAVAVVTVEDVRTTAACPIA